MERMENHILLVFCFFYAYTLFILKFYILKRQKNLQKVKKSIPSDIKLNFIISMGRYFFFSNKTINKFQLAINK